MTEHKRTSKFGLGLVVGTVLGGLAGLFLSPKTGKENRKLAVAKINELQKKLEEMDIQKKAKEIFGEITEESTRLYKQARKELTKKLEGVTDKIKDFDRDDYMRMVQDVIEDLKKEAKDSPAILRKLQEYLVDNWNETTLEDTVKKVTKKKNKS